MCYESPPTQGSAAAAGSKGFRPCRGISEIQQLHQECHLACLVTEI